MPISHLSPAAGVIFRGQGASPTKLINTRFMEADIETPLTSHVGPHVAAARRPSRVGNRGLSFKLPNQESPCARSGLATSLFPGVELGIPTLTHLRLTLNQLRKRTDCFTVISS